MRQADHTADINNILPLVKRTLRQQNEKGLAKYGTALKDNDLTVLELLYHSLEEQIDNLQYTIIAIQQEERKQQVQQSVDEYLTDLLATGDDAEHAIAFKILQRMKGLVE
ncbi:hypothetical protein [Macrococcus brunensis]|uniref:hypothetical protein n=1 Tax=Macrococcus brunensis TaxID=198483 RepID=UPI001EEFE7A6|nr:hypothetical protein [Macrococcus brunensis]ULG73198.1 hypothetical protein MGG13_05590 [Macrococcus brunensis]